ncbi:hypothetical protein [Marinitenerispora sediminis]|uniref:Uncharacterized protein n=1 Tax=Marinitenerispora sediminis TaxID=1931232 RepID=A0A368SZ96_9ACTN|nr:hypothetical protein [Marinitenerispora sediminis]RCV50567.1 hypothetical protein DEF28_17725 [Marinitenerispora sediminis]RCV50758.1 hypothetical protein DEF24_23860 [Marinitenerispora sediminis]RCV54903.1 hypothetical protein DEF23_15125 [Marinitenerispora sediminis]
MTDPFDDGLERRLRDALRAEADSVQPSPAALDRIRTRTQRSRPFWFGGVWLRPTLAVTAAALIVGSVLLGTPQFRDQVLPDSFTTASEDDAPPPGSGPANAGDQLDAPAASGASPDRPLGPAASSAPEAQGGDPMSGPEAASRCPSAPPSEERSPTASADDDTPAENDADPACVPSPQPSEPGDTDPSDDGSEPGDGGDGGPGSPTAPPEDPPEPSEPPADGTDSASALQ